VIDDDVLVVDDEPLARRFLVDALGELGWRGAILEAHDGAAALELAARRRPPLIFLDMVMPRMSGLELLERLPYEPKVVFTTAHERYAVTAFELGALDYLLKPFGCERLARVLARLGADAPGAADGLRARAREHLSPRARPGRLFVRDGKRTVAIALADLERVQGADDYVVLHVGPREYLLALRIADLEQRLAADGFVRIHRSHLVNLALVTAIEPCDVGRVEVVMRSGARVPASRAGTRRLRAIASGG
jgi:two-component system LytT family response regulator